MNKFLSVSLIIIVPLITEAQKKSFTFDQLFRGNFPAIFNALPEIEGWVDDDHYIEVRTDERGSKTSWSVNVRDGKAVAYTGDDNDEGSVTVADAENITFSPDKKYVAYTKKNDLYVMDAATHKETRLTTDGSDVIKNGYASWLYYEEILGRRSKHKAFWWSPDSKQIAYMRFDDSKVPVFPIYVADGQHGYLEKERYPKAGDPNPTAKIGIINIGSAVTTWTDFDTTVDKYLGTPYWSPGSELIVQWMNREQDSLLLYHINKSNGSKTLIYTETQPTWVQLDEDERFYFLSGNNGFILKSDKDGWENLYLYDLDGNLLSQLTNGNFWNTGVLAVDEKNKQVYFKSRKENSARFDVYKASFNGGNVKRLSFGNYSHDVVQMSPTGKYFITSYSNLTSPPAMALVDSKGKIVRQLGNVKGPEFDNYQLAQTKLITVRSSDDAFNLPVSITYPLNFDSTKKYPVWITIYGGPDAGTVFDRWKPSGGLTQWWAQEGIIQVSMDNRVSGHFGKKGMNYSYKQLGKWEIDDYVTCAKWIRSQPWADAAKIGISGGSFGGYITCMALTYGADVFTHGIASYSVTDWSLYDTHYTERFMNKPQDNPEGYKKTSVMTYVDRYKGLLRIVHGTTDDNVHMQNSLQLINALEDRGKHFELMMYPNQRHGIQGGKAYHNFMETCRFIYENMLNEPLPREFSE
jgi:dipeptidyl-peptidase-4